MSEAAQSTVKTIEEFLKKQDNLAYLNDFDEAFRGREQRLPNREARNPTAQLAWLLYHLCRDHFFLLRVSSLKLAEIARGILWALQVGNPTVQIALVRSLFEHLSALSFQVDELRKVSENLARQGDHGKIVGAILKHRSIVERLYYGRDMHGRTGHPKPFHVNDFRKVLQHDYQEQDMVYATLCDYVHPNYGSNSLVSSGELGRGTLSQPATVFDRQIAFANACTVRCLTLASDYELQGSAQLILLDGRIEIASRDGERPATVFSKKGLTHLGDGKGQQTAVEFTKARTHIEAVEMIYRYLEQEKLDLTGPRQTVELKDGFLFEVLHTNKGPVWFKTRIDWD
jgi:hypothetical protein